MLSRKLDKRARSIPISGLLIPLLRSEGLLN